MMQSRGKGMGKCPSCREKIYIGERARIGQPITCSYCNDRLEIIQLNPVIFDWLYIPSEGSYYFDEEFGYGGGFRVR